MRACVHTYRTTDRNHLQMASLQLPREMRLRSLQRGQSQVVVVAVPGVDWPIQLGGFGGVYLIQRVFRRDALGRIASEAIDELLKGAGRSDVLIHGLSLVAYRGQQVLLDGEHVHLDIAAAIRGRHDGQFEKRVAATAARAGFLLLCRRRGEIERERERGIGKKERIRRGQDEEMRRRRDDE